MRIIQSISKADGTKSYTTEIEVINDYHIRFSRVINSTIYTVELKREQVITIGQLSNICRIDDEMFKMINNSDDK